MFSLFKRDKDTLRELQSTMTRLEGEMAELKKMVNIIGADTSIAYCAAYPEEYEKVHGGRNEKDDR